MAIEIRDIVPGAFAPSKRSRRYDDESGGDDFARWMSDAPVVNDDETPKRPLTQTPMTSLEDMLLLARAREQIESAAVNATPVDAYAHSDMIETSDDEDQYVFDFISTGFTGVRLDKRI